jgi:hypothetical protein
MSASSGFGILGPGLIFIGALALLLKLVDYLIEALRCILHERVGSQMHQRLSNRPEEKLSGTDWFRSRLVMEMSPDSVS